MTFDTDNPNNSNQQPPPYVYPEPGSGTTGGGKPPKNPRRSTRTIGIVALLLAVAVLFSALTGTAVYLMMKDKLALPETTQKESVPSEKSTETGQTETTTQSTEQSDLHNPFFSLADAAARHEEGKETLSTIEIAARGKPTVVAITIETTVMDIFGQIYRPTAAGSGFIISEDGYIVTNNHVVEGADTITVVLDNDEAYEAMLVGTDPDNDIAVIKIKASDLPTVVLGDSDQLLVGELAVAIGNPLGQLSGSVTAGIISALDREITVTSGNRTQKLTLLQTDAAINAGNSGGALFNSFGEVIGINTLKNIGTGVEGLGFAIPINHAKPIIESLIQYGYVKGRPKIGIVGRDITAQMAEYYRLPQGIYILEVEPNSAADKAGLRVKDIIIAVNGKEVKTIDELNSIKNTMKPGDTMTLTVIRDGRELTVDLVLDEDVPTEYTKTAY